MSGWEIALIIMAVGISLPAILLGLIFLFAFIMFIWILWREK